MEKTNDDFFQCILDGRLSPIKSSDWKMVSPL